MGCHICHTWLTCRFHNGCRCQHLRVRCGLDAGLTPTVCHSLVCCSPFTDGPAIHEYVLSAIFAVDMALKFRLAFREHEQLVGCPKRILQRYMRWDPPAPHAGRSGCSVNEEWLQVARCHGHSSAACHAGVRHPACDAGSRMRCGAAATAVQRARPLTIAHLTVMQQVVLGGSGGAAAAGLHCGVHRHPAQRRHVGRSAQLLPAVPAAAHGGRTTSCDVACSHCDLTPKDCCWRSLILMLTHAVAVMQLRMYRVPQFFLELEYKLNVSLLGVTLVRNFVFL